MKKFVSFAPLFIFAVTLLTACHGAGGNAAKNVISSATLTAEQAEMLELFANDKQEVLVFDFDTKDTFTTLAVWVETYENGVLTDRPAGVIANNDTSQPLKGRVAVLIDQNPGFQWTITLVNNGAKTTHSAAEASGLAMDSALARGYGPMSGEAVIEKGREIILYSSLFTSGNTLSTFDTQTLAQSPEILREYDFVHLIKCKFS